jgi:hypothetical protein
MAKYSISLNDGPTQSFDYNKKIQEISSLWGKPQAIENPNFQLKNYEPNSIFELWHNQRIPIAEYFVSKYLGNDENDNMLSSITPRVEVTDLYFQTNKREISLQIYDVVGEGGPYKTLTSRTAVFTDKLTRRKLGITLAAGVIHDKFSQEFAHFMRALAKSAELTIDLEQIFEYFHNAFRNMCFEKQKKSFDWSRKVNLAADEFGVIPLDPKLFLSIVENIKKTKIPTLDTCIIPAGFSALFNGVGVSTIPKKSVVILDGNNPNSSQLSFMETDGFPSLLTFNGISLYQLHDFHMNSDIVVQPLKSIVLLARNFPMNPNIKSNSSHCFNSLLNAIMIYCMTPTSGGEVVIEYDKKLLLNTFLFDLKTYGPSEYLHRYVDYMNTQMKKRGSNHPMKWQLLERIKKTKNLTFDVNADEGYDCETPITGSEQESYEGFRDTSMGYVYNPTRKQYYVTNRIGDLPKEVLPNEYIMKCANGLSKHFAFTNPNFPIESWISDIRYYMSRIQESPWSQNYLIRLVEQNIYRLKTKDNNLIPAVHEMKNERQQRFGVISAIDWEPNHYGSMNLVKGNVTGGKPSYPAGFASIPGLRTIASKKDSDDDYAPIANEANRLVGQGDILVNYIREYVNKKTDVITEELTKPWFVNVDSTQTLLDHIMPETVPVFINLNYFKSLRPTTLQESEFTRRVSTTGSAYVRGLFESANIFYEFIFKNKDYQKLVTQNKDIINHTILTKFINDLPADAKIPTHATSLNFLISTYMLPTLKSIEEEKVEKLYNDFYNNIIDELQKQNLTTITTIRTAILNLFGLNAKLSYMVNLVANKNNKKIAKDAQPIAPLVVPTIALNNRIADSPDITIGDGTNARDINPDVDIKPHQDNEKYYSIQMGASRIGWIRTSLIASPKLIEYIELNPNQVVGVRLGNPKTNYNSPIMDADLTEGDIANRTTTFSDVKKIVKNSVLSKSFNTSLSHIAVSMKYNTDYDTNEKGENDMDMDSNDEYDDKMFPSEDIMQKTSSTSKKIFEKFKTDIKYDTVKPRDDPYEHSRPYKQYSITPGQTKSDAYIDDFPGPWESNFNYYKSIGGDAIALFFLCVILAPFDADTFANVAKIGQLLMRIDLMRNAEEHEMYSAVVLKSGPETMIMCYGRAIVLPWVDGVSGAVTVSSEFFLGSKRNNPENIYLVPYAAPCGIIGGNEQTIMDDPEQFFHSNKDGRPSIMAVALPVCHISQDYPFDLFGNPLYKSPSNNMSNRKYAKYAPSKFLEFVINASNINDHNAYLKSVCDDFWKKGIVSTIIHKGCARYTDHNGNWLNIKSGTGPKSNPSQNFDNAYMAWNGVGAFPSYRPSDFYTV